MLAAARLADPSAPVPGCPEWTTTDLVWHIGGVHDFWGYVVRERSMMPDDYEDPESRAAASPAEGFESAHTFAERAGRRTAPRARARPIPRRRCGRGRRSRTSSSCSGGWPTRPPRTASTPSTRRVASTGSTRCSRPTGSTSSWPTSSPTRSGHHPAAGRVACISTAPTSRCRRAPASGRSAPATVRRASSRGITPRRTPRCAAKRTTCSWCCGGGAPLDAVTVFGDESLAQAFVDRAGTE